jgi:hypothetical protein
MDSCIDTNFHQELATTAINKINSRMQLRNGEEIRHSFFQYVKGMWNMDDTPLYLDMPVKRTIEIKGRRCVPY